VTQIEVFRGEEEESKSHAMFDDSPIPSAVMTCHICQLGGQKLPGLPPPHLPSHRLGSFSAALAGKERGQAGGSQREEGSRAQTWTGSKTFTEQSSQYDASSPNTLLG